MIVRILGEGQYRLDDAAFAKAGEFDDRVQAAAEAGDEAAFAAALSELLDVITASGTELAADEFEGSDAVIPGHGTTLAEARDLLSSEGLIPN
ncbi:MAG: PspA-associated protein PspAA [Thermoleophilia bacterium]